MTVNDLIYKLQQMVDKEDAGNLEVYAADAQGGSYDVGGPSIEKKEELSYDWGALEKEYHDNLDDRVVVIHVDN